MEWENVKLFGYAVFVYKPTEEVLKTPIDITEIPKEIYFNFIEQLQEILLDLDIAYASDPKRIKKKRVILVKNIRHKDTRRRILYLTPFPTSIISALKNLRADIAEFLLEYGIKLETEPELKRVIYLIPQSKLEFLSKKVEIWNELVEKLRKTIEVVSQSQHFEKIKNLLAEMNIKAELRIPSLRDVMIDIYPITLEVSQNIPDALRSVILKTRRLYLSNVLYHIYEKAKEELASKRPNKERINSLIQMAEEFGLISVAKELREVLTIEEIAKSMDFLNARIAALVKALERKEGK
jgi:hypothetical protein